MALAQENAPLHVARTMQQMLNANRVRLLPWLGKSPDLNPTEHVWGLLKLLKTTDNILSQQQNKRQMPQTIAQVRNGIQQWYLQRYNESMRSRCRAVIVANAGIKTCDFQI